MRADSSLGGQPRSAERSSDICGGGNSRPSRLSDPGDPTYDWTQWTDESRIARAEWTTADRLAASSTGAALAQRSLAEDRGEPR